MPKPRIAIFTGNYNHIRDGVSNTLNRLVGHLEYQGYPVLVFGPWTPVPAMEHAGNFVPVYAIPAPGRSDYRISMGFPETEKQKLKDFKPDLIHIATPDILGLHALRFAIKENIPVVTSYHTHFSSYLKYYGLGFLERFLWLYLHWFYSKCEQLYAPSESMIEELKKIGVKTEMKLWTRGVDTSLFHPGNRSEEWREKTGFRDDHIVVTFVSRLVWEKNLDVVASVFNRIMKGNKSIRTLVVGDGPAREEMSRMTPDTVFAGYLGGMDLAMAYASSDIFFFPSDTESFGNVTLEAMSSGLPAVVAEAVGSRSLVKNHINGFRTAPDNETGFAEFLLEISINQSLRNEMAEASRQQAELYDWNRILDQLLLYYEDVLKKKA